MSPRFLPSMFAVLLAAGCAATVSLQNVLARELRHDRAFRSMTVIMRFMMRSSSWKFCALAATVAWVGTTSCSSPPPIPEDVQVRDGAQALELLMAGNARFVAGQPRHSHESLARRARLQTGQNPFGIVLGCADSRVPPELVFDGGLGDLFVIRVAGNVVGVDESGSIEYAVAHLGTPLVLVLGHEGCGAVTATLAAPQDEPEELAHLLRTIEPGLSGIDPDLPADERIHLGVEANVRHSLQALEAIRDREGGKKDVLFAGAVYEVETGRVRLLE